MIRNGRLSMALHALLHMAMLERAATSQELAACMGANAVQVRRAMAGLRDAGLVRSAKGRGGGWTIARPLAELTLRDIHVALAEPALFAIGHRNRETSCLVEQTVNGALEDTLRDAESFLLERFASISVERLAQDFRRRLRAARRRHEEHG